MNLKEEFIINDIGEVAGFNGSTSRIFRKLMLDITPYNKVASFNFYLMDYNTAHNGLLGCGWTLKEEQCH